MERLFKGLNRKSADLALTILASQAIGASVKQTGPNRFDLWVLPQDLDLARFHLKSYARENPRPDLPLPQVSAPAAPVPVLVSAMALIHIFLVFFGLHGAAILNFGASPYFLGQGQTFRAITALFLHADTAHLLGNLAGLCILVLPLIRLTGPGTGSLFLLASATAGNLLANSMSTDARLSIGASTAVMAAAGLLSARQALVPGITFWRPLAAGLTLTAFLSHGPRTDLSAHLFGFLAGMGTGALVFPLFRVWHRPWMEPTGLALVLVLLVAALVSGLLMAS